MEGAEWSNFNATVCVNEEADFMAQLFPNPNDVNLNYTHNYQIMANNKDINEDRSSYFSCDSISNTQNLYPFSHDSCYDHRRNDHHDHDHHDHDDVHHYHNDCFNDDDNHHHHHLASPSLPIDFLQCHMEGHENNDNEDQSEMDNNTVAEDNKISSSSSCKIAKKRPRALEVQRGKKNMKVKRSRSNLSLGGGDNEEEEEKDGNKSCSSGSLEDDCSSKGGTTTTTTSTTNTTTNTNTKAVNSNGKTRASRGSATDPQSLYARKRRERINERLKILQSLVPNGTKVDISTMLEEAVQYVKFLQLQIKLLSSDEHWMYAPIAYNGMNIGLDFKINLPR